MSSTVHNPNRKDYLRPSKTLQDLRNKLGKVFLDAKLIECPQNAFELSRLQKKIDELEKQKYRHLAEVNREQRILYNSLSSKFLSDASISNLSDPVVVEMIDNKLAPPGFRFHADGSPKLQYPTKSDIITSSAAGVVESNGVVTVPLIMITDDTLPRSESVQMNGIEDIPKYGIGMSLRPTTPTHSTSLLSSRPASARQTTPRDISKQEFSKPPTITYNDVDYEQEIQNLEKIIKQLKKDMTVKRASDSTDASGTPIQKHNYLRAHSRADEAETKQFKYAPNPSLIQKSSTNNTLLNKSGRRNNAHSTKCMACQMKMKQIFTEEILKKRKGPQNLKVRWNHAPSGTYVQSPSSLSASGRVKSAPMFNLNYKRYANNPEMGETILKTYVIDHKSTYKSMPNIRKLSQQSPSLINLRSSPSALQSFFAIKRFSSPTERESKLLAYKSRAETECKEVNMKVCEFLQKLKEDNIKRQQETENRRYYFLNNASNENQITVQ